MKNAIEYQVTITATVRRVEPAGREWARKADGSEGYAYTPPIVKEFVRDLTVFEQRFETLDVSAVARMLNEPQQLQFAPLDPRGTPASLPDTRFRCPYKTGAMPGRQCLLHDGHTAQHAYEHAPGSGMLGIYAAPDRDIRLDVETSREELLYVLSELLGSARP